MNPDNNPFTPGQPVDAEFFTGRTKQVEELRAMVRMARKKRLQVGWISGERGMGKSSLALFINHLAERHEQAVVAHVHLGGVKTVDELAQATHLQLLKDNQTQRWGKALWDAFGKHIESVDTFGVKFQFKDKGDTLPARASEFPDALNQIVRTAGEDREVLLLTFDDINGLADNPEFSHWLKSMVDGEVTSRKHNHVCLIFAGLEERLRKMQKANPSVIRVFQPLIHIHPWTTEERENFFRNSFAKGNATIGKNAIAELARYSEGLPIVAHQIGHAVWGIARTEKITLEDVHDGVVVAANNFGERFLKSDVIQALRSDKYRSILRKIAQRPDWHEIEFSREQLRSLTVLTADEKKTMDNFLNRMRTLGAIVPVKERDRGVYRFATHVHRIYFFLEAREATIENGSKNTAAS
ncbi:MAG: ATP-binding protein [Nitrospira sp.]|nr:ATP-binding protein [Nitrospira sp.]